MARKKEKQKKGNWGKRGAIPFLVPLIFIAITIILLIILVKNPEICLFGSCWRLVPLRFSKAFLFYLTLAGFFLVQVALVWAYWQIGTKIYLYGMKVVAIAKSWTTNIKRYIIMHHG